MYEINFQLTCSIGQYEDMRPTIHVHVDSKNALENELMYLTELQKKMYKSISPKYKKMNGNKERVQNELNKMENDFPQE